MKRALIRIIFNGEVVFKGWTKNLDTLTPENIETIKKQTGCEIEFLEYKDE